MRRPLLALAPLVAACAPAVVPPPAPTPVAAPVAAAPTPTAPVAAPAAARAARPLQGVVDSIAAAPAFANAHWGVLVVDAATGDTLAARQVGTLFMPASNQKLLTAAVALASLDAAHRWRTTLAATGPVTDGMLRGDLVVIGRGDPTWSAAAGWPDAMAPLLALADTLRARGVTRIAGRVRLDASAFPGAGIGYGWDWDDLAEPYGAGVGAQLWNDGMVSLAVLPCARAVACVTTTPAATVPRVVAGHAVQGERQPRRALRWWRDSSPDFTVRTAGVLGTADTVRIDLAQRDANEAWLAAFGEALAARGIRVQGTGDGRAAGRDTLVAWTSRLTLAAALGPMLKPSQNQWAEAIWRTVALERTGVGSEDSARAVTERWLRGIGVPDTWHAVRDGSGLSRHDYVTPGLMVAVLRHARTQPWWATLVDALPVAGREGTLETRMRGTPLAGNVRAKTGTVDKARNLSGTMRTADGRELLFAILANNFSVPSREVDRAAETILRRAFDGAGAVPTAGSAR